MEDGSFLTSIAAQLPVVASFIAFVVYLLKYIAEQQKQRDETWLTQLESFRSTCDKTNERLIATIESQDTRWQQAVQQRDEQWRTLLKEMQDDMRQHSADNREDVRELREAIKDLVTKMNDILGRIEGEG